MKVGTKNFTLQEFTFSRVARVHGIDNTLPEGLQENAQRTLEALQAIRDAIGRPIIITSGYRSPLLNDLVHGAPQSQHLYASAADIICPGVSNKELAQAIWWLYAKEEVEALSDMFECIYEYDWVHLSLRNGLRTEPVRYYAYDGTRFYDLPKPRKKPACLNAEIGAAPKAASSDKKEKEAKK